MTAVVESLHSDPNLHSLFLIAAFAKVPRFENLSCTAVDTVFKEMVQKLSHTRMQEYLNSFKQREAAYKSNANLAGQKFALLTFNTSCES